MVNLSPKSYTFCLYFFHLTPEYGSNTDSDPQQCSIIFRKTAVGALIHFVTKNDPAIAFDTMPRIYLIYKKITLGLLKNNDDETLPYRQAEPDLGIFDRIRPLKK